MKFDKQILIDGYKNAICQKEKRIVELQGPCERQLRSAERDLLRKEIKGLEKKIKELEDECTAID